ncbi:histidine kinase [Vallitalea pronyensis]|uniref:Histidine kinase n=1 Tax=Vallitalea pronyensis TaxID=1348613 RepID=A0A8J8SGC5_9FIRM|nr:histidine kinase [Vallitalea pronyensis]QUI22630.1 histidine kinase [Vallitalea pronyensis]
MKLKCIGKNIKFGDEMVKKFLDKLYKPINNMKIFYKLMLYIICIGMIPIITFSVTSYQYTQNQIEQRLFQSSEQLFNNYIESVQFKLNIYENLMWGIISNNSVQTILSQADQWQQKDTYEVYEKISKSIDNMYKIKRVEGIYNVVIYSYDENFPRDGHNVSNISRINEEIWGHHIDLEGKDLNTFHYNIPTFNKKVISIVRPINHLKSNNWNRIGFIKIDILNDSLFGLNLKSTNQYKNSLYILDEHQNLVYSEGDLQYQDDEMAAIQGLLTDRHSPTHMETLDNKDVVFFKDIKPYGWKVFFISHYSSIHKIIGDDTKGVITYCIIVTLLVILITILFSKKFSKRIQRLNKKMLKVQRGDLDITEKVEGNDEIGELDNYFNGSIEKIKSLVRENYIQKLEKREAELVALQFQINPHFLYNTLESINYIAEIYDCKEVSIMSQKLGEMFRYSLNKDSEEFVMFQQEENHIKNYIDIQNIRFENKYQLKSHVSEDVKNSKVLKFILQPIVENAVTYGFNKRDTGIIQINASIQSDYLLISVSDNGTGIAPEKLKELNVLINDLSFNLDGYQKSVGLRNVNLRIKMTCGEEYGIKIDNHHDGGTTVTYRLPVYA